MWCEGKDPERGGGDKERGVGIGAWIFGDGGFSDYQLIKQN